MPIKPKEPQDLFTDCDRLYLPEELKTSDLYDVRPFEDEEPWEKREEFLYTLANSMERDGQILPCVATEDLTLIIGHQKRAAALLINEKRTVNGQPLFRLKVRIAHGGDLRHTAIISNTIRKQLSPIQIALLIQRVRQEKCWFDTRHTQQVADYLGVDQSTLYDHEKLLKLDKDTQRKVHRGEISKQSALLLLKIPVEDRAKAVERAAELQEEERLDKALNDCAANKLSKARATRIITEKRERVEIPAITRAIRETCKTVPKEVKALGRSKKELVESIAQLADSSYPAALREFAVYWEKYARGVGDLASLKAKFLGIISTEPRKPVRSETAAAS